MLATIGWDKKLRDLAESTKKKPDWEVRMRDLAESLRQEPQKEIVFPSFESLEALGPFLSPEDPQYQTTYKDIMPSGRMGIPERAGKNFFNELILSDIERGRPTSAIGRGLPALERTFKGFEKAGIPPSEEMTFLDYINPAHYGRAAWEMLKGFYGPKSRKEQEQAHQALKQYRGAWEFAVPIAETTGEKVTDVAAGLGAFVTRIIAAKKLMPPSLVESPNIQSALAFELVNTEGLPGTGAATSGVLRGIAQIPASTLLGKTGKLGLASTVFGGATALRGGSKEDIAIAAMIPVTMAAIGAAQNKISDVKLVEHLRYKYPFMRDVSLRNSLKYSKSLREAYQIKHGKLSPEQWSKRVNQWSKNNAQNLDSFFKEATAAFKKAGGQAPKQITGKARLEAGLQKQVRVSPEVAKKAVDLVAKGVPIGEVDKMLSIAKATGEMPTVAPERPSKPIPPPAIKEATKPAEAVAVPTETPTGEVIEKKAPVEEVAAQRGAFQKYQESIPNATEQEIVRFMIEDGLRPPEAVLKRNEQMPEVEEIRAQDKTEAIAKAPAEAVTPEKPSERYRQFYEAMVRTDAAREKLRATVDVIKQSKLSPTEINKKFWESTYENLSDEMRARIEQKLKSVLQTDKAPKEAGLELPDNYEMETMEQLGYGNTAELIAMEHLANESIAPSPAKVAPAVTPEKPKAIALTDQEIHELMRESLNKNEYTMYLQDEVQARTQGDQEAASRAFDQETSVLFDRGYLYDENNKEWVRVSAKEKARVEKLAAPPPAKAPAVTPEKPKAKKKKISAKDEFKVGDVIDTKGHSNMADPITIREVQGNTLKFTDAEGVEYAGMARATVRRLIEGGSWGKAAPLPAKVAKEPWEMTHREFYDIAGSEYTAVAKFGLTAIPKKLPTTPQIPLNPDTGHPYRGATPEERIHKAVIHKAIREGKPVPREVLEEYKGESWAKMELKKQAAPVKEVKAKVPEGEISRRPVTVEGKKYYPIALPTDRIGVDAARFQFKLGAKLVGGVTEALKGVEKFDPVKGGQILVWQDKTGKYWVVDGHHRVALAKKTGAETLETWVVSEKDGVTEQDARAIGALRNLADGKGTAVDAAKLFRDSNITLAELRKNAVPTESTIVQQGLDMADLSDEVFRLVIDERLPANMAATIGKQVKNPTQQKQVADLILEGEVETLRQAELLAATIDSAPVLTKTEQTLFGLETTEKSLYAERAKILANVEKKLKTNKKVFGVLATQTGIIEAKGNILAKVENLATKEKAEEVLFMLEKLANTKGPVAEALNDATKQYAENPTKENLSKVTGELLEKWTEGPGRLRIPVREGVPELPLERAPEKVEKPAKPVKPGMEIYADRVPPTDVPSKVALHKAVAQALNQDYKKVRTTKKKYKGVKDEKQLYEKYGFAGKKGLFIHPENPYPEMRAAWTISTKGKGLFGGTMKPGFIDVTPLEKALKTSLKLVEPAKITQRAFGKEPGAIIIKGIHQADVGRIEFNEAEIEALDSSLEEFGEKLSRYSNKVLKNLMAARGKPVGANALLIKKEALIDLARKAPELVGVRKMITRIADHNYKYLQSVVGDDIHYVKDYYYGIFKDTEKATVENLLDWWQTTDRFTKQKKLLTVADALAFGVELRDYNPVNNLRSEYMAIARLDGMIYMRDELMRTGKGRYIDTKEDAPHDWEKLKEPVFKDVRVHPEAAVMIKSLLSTNKLRRHLASRGLTHTNNALRTLKFVFSMFHQLNIMKQSIADEGYLKFIQPSATRGITRGFKKSDPIFRTPAYKDYIRHGGGHRYSIESQAQRAFTNFVESLDKRLGFAFKVGALPIRIPKAYVKWLFQSYIPKVKYAKYLDRVAEIEEKLGRPLDPKSHEDSALKIEILKEQQNFYGMMNERLFGRSGTVTSLMRLWYMSPGYFEGNFRTILKSVLQWGGKEGYKASRSRSNIINSLILSAIVATATTLIMTGKPPKKPETREDLRDLFKGDTGKVDDKGRKIMVDFLTYDRDYWNILGQALIGKPDKAAEAVIKRSSGMVAPSAQVALDIANIAAGRALVDWKNDRVTEVTDPFARKVLKIAIHEIKRTEPISVGVYGQSRRRDQTAVLSALTALLGVRPTLAEKDKREQEVLHRIYSLKGQQEKLYQYLGGLRNPRKAVEKYNKTVKTILDSPMTPKVMKAQWEPKLIIDVERLLENKAYTLGGATQKPEDIERAVKYLKNFGVTQDEIEGYIRRKRAREVKKTPISPLDRDRVIGLTRRIRRAKERME